MAEAPIVDQPKPEAMNMTQGSARDAVDALASGDTQKFRTAVNDMLANKVADYLDVKKIDVAQNFMKQQEVDPEKDVVSDVEIDDEENQEIKDEEV